MTFFLRVVNTHPYGCGMAERRTLTVEDWFQAAFRAVAQDGVQAIRAERLAAGLGVSKGSFYWHFADVAALRSAMLLHWQAMATDQIIQATDAGGGSADARLTRLIGVATSDLTDDYGGFAIEAAIRDWARHDPDAAAAVAMVDDRRLTYLRGLFAMAGQDPAQRARSARQLYAGLIGTQHMTGGTREIAQGDLLHLLNALLAR
jgi:AcrR family transcriptional regulator